MKKLTEKELLKAIEGCKKNDRQSQKIIYMHYYSTLLPVCYRYTSNRDEALDLLHDVFLKIFEKIKKYKHTGSFEGWLKRLTVNYAIDRFRKNKNIRPLSTDDEEHPIQISEEEPDDDSIFARVSSSDLVDAIRQLPDGYKMVFCLYYLEEMSHKEIAEKLNINEGTSKSNLFKAKAKLKDILTKKLLLKS
jgi:RNA polymerase sigma-70 factor (ECF subfamily)